MKKICSALLLITFVMIASAQEIQFPGNWKFIMQDDAAFSQQDFDDASWQSIPVPAGWDKLGINKEQAVGWYRVNISIPAALRNQDLVFFAGTIDDADETFFNGVRIGKTGKFPPGDQTAWDVERQYNIPKALLKENNSIAIRVYNGAGGGGIYSGHLRIISRQEAERQRAEQLKSKKSYFQLTTSNGLIAAVYNAKTNLLEHMYPHIFSYYDSAQPVLPVLSNLKLKGNAKPMATGYWQNTHIIRVQYPSLELFYFAPFTSAEKILYVVAQGDEKAIAELDFSLETGAGKITMLNATQKRKGKAERYFAFGFEDKHHALPALEKALQHAMETALLDAELQFMRNKIAACSIPSAISKEERNVVEQSISVLKMSQVASQEIFPLSHGQVVASLRPGVWAISWVRDAAFAIEAMSKLGMYAEAKKALEFMLKAQPTNQYVHYLHSDGKDYGIAVPYIISVTRYFGNGREESDFNAEGPNIELDDFGLFLTACYHYVNESGDKTFFTQWQHSIDTIGRAIIQNINEKNVIRRESGPWEHHLPGKEFMWTSGTCARGLQLISMLQKKYDMPFREFENAGLRIYHGIQQNAIIDHRYIKGNTTETNPADHHYFDAATFELFANGLFTDKKLFASHMQEYNRHNRAMQDPLRGYIRFNSQDSYENQEWPFAGLRVSVAQNKLGSKKEAKQLLDRITIFAGRNFNLIPEILSNELNVYKGAIPMVGYGAGAYVLAVLEYYQP